MFRAALTQQYTSIVGDLSGLQIDAIFSDKETEDMLRDIFKGSDDIPKDLFKKTFAKLSDGVSTGYGGNPKDGVDGDMVYHLKNNVKGFSAFKANHYKDTMISLLVDQDNKQRLWADFLKEAKKVDNDYNRNWLAAEYNMAIRQARAAKQWSTFERDKEVYPNLQWMPSQAANPRQSHQRYYGMILPIDHPFWSTGLPPLDWGCKCWVKQTREQANDFEEADIAPIPQRGLAGNAGIEKKVFTASSTYLSGLSKEDKAKVKSFLLEHAELGYETFEIKVGKNKITVPIDAHADDLKANIDFLLPFVKKNKRNWGVNSHTDEDNIKNPELHDSKGVIGDLVTTEKQPLSSIKTAFKKLQGDNQLGAYKKVFLAIDFDDKLSRDNYFDMLKSLNGRMKTNPKVQYVMLKNGKKTCILEGKDDFETKLTKIKKELL